MLKSVYKKPTGARRVYAPRRDDVSLEALDTAAPVVVDKATECHVTPPAVAARMVGYIPQCERILEPSAGTGNLINAALKAGYREDQIAFVERHCELFSGINKRFPSVIDGFNGCFLEYRRAFDGIVMNPPFKQVRKHVEHAYSLLYHGGTLVALVPVTFKSAIDFYELERLPDATFASAKVNTMIIEMVKGI